MDPRRSDETPSNQLEEPDQRSDFDFIAFLSYRHIEPDRRWAKWLHRSMESYRVPRRLTRDEALPRRVGRIFRDEEELAATSDLSAGIRQALAHSDYLIIVCSPRTPASSWVEAEVEYFRELGRGDHILACLIEAEPGEAFPKSLRAIRPAPFYGREPLAADIRPNGSESRRYRQRMAKLRLLAAVLGCRFDDLRQREQERRTRVLANAVAAVALLAIVIAGLGFLAEANRERAVAERDRALQNQSLFVAGLSRRETAQGDTTAGILLALEALPLDLARRDRPLVPEAIGALYDAVLARRELTILRPHGELVKAAFGDGGRRVLTVTKEGAQLWNAEDGSALASLGSNGAPTKRAVFSPDGARILSTSATGPAYLWDAHSGAELATIGEGSALASWADFLPGGGRILLLSMGGSGLWDTQSARPIASFGLHFATPQSISADGSRLATFPPGGGDVQLWDAESGRAISKIIDRGTEFPALSADGKRVLTWSLNGTARVWEADSARLLSLIREPLFLVQAALSPDGSRIVTFAGDGAVHLWDAASGDQLRLLMSHAEDENRALFSPDGRRMIIQTGLQPQARLFDPATGDELAELSNEVAIHEIAFSRSAARLITYKGRADLWDAVSGRKIATLRHDASTARSNIVFNPGGSVDEAAFNADGSRIVTASEDGSARLWSSAEGTELAVFRGHSAPVRHAAFSPDDRRILTVSADGTARLWDSGDGPEVTSLRGHHGEVPRAIFSPEGSRVLSAGKDHPIRLWDASDANELTSIKDNGEGAWAVAFDAAGKRFATVFSDGAVGLWESAAGSKLAVLRGHERVVERAMFSRDGEWLLTEAGDDRTARIWDLSRDGAPTVLRHEGSVDSVEISADGTRVLTTALGRTERQGLFELMAYLWEMPSGRKLATLREQGSELSLAILSPDGNRVLTGAKNGMARLWAAADGRELAVLPQHENFVSEAAFTADGQRILTVAYDRVGHLLEGASGGEIARLEQRFGVRHIYVAQNGIRALTLSAGEEPPRVWDARSGKSIAALAGHDGFIDGAALSPDGRYAVTSSYLDGTTRFWDTDSGEQRAILRSADRVSLVAFAPDGSRVMVVSIDGTLRLFPVFATDAALVAHARAAVPRKFTEQDRRRFFLAPE